VRERLILVGPRRATVIRASLSTCGKGWPVAAVGNDRRNILLVHGAWHGSWCWERLAPELRAEGWNVATIDLPSAAAEDSGLYADARAIRERLGRMDGRVVVLGHSYGGLPVTEAAAGVANVSQLMYLSAFQLEPGRSLAGAASLQLAQNGTLQPPDDPIDRLYGGVGPDVADRAAARLVPQATKSFTETLTSAAWKTIPSAYLVCEEDRAIPAALQESMATRASTVHRIRSGHSPFLSMPAQLARLVTTAADIVQPRRL
jgi:pimeloyl-ACP methyl ester carboxylesterase